MATKICRMHVVQTLADDGFMIVYGVDQDGFSRTLHVAYSPCFYVRTQENELEPDKSSTLDQCVDSLSACDGYLKLESKEVHGRRFTYWEPHGSFWQARFKNVETLRKAAKTLTGQGYELFQSDLDPVVRFYAERDMDTHGILEVNYELMLKSTQNPVPASQVKGASASSMPNKSVIAYYDLETFGAGYRFPTPREASDVIFNVCTIFRRMNETNPYLVTMHAVGTYADDAAEQLRARAQAQYPDVAVKFFAYATEHDMMVAWCTQTGAQTPSYMFAHNGMGFDLPYLFERCVGWTESSAAGQRSSVYKSMYGGKRNANFQTGFAAVTNKKPIGMHKLGRAYTSKSGKKADDDSLEMRVTASNTAAHGHVEVVDVPLRGIVHVDSLLYMRKFHSSLDQLSLDFLAKKFLGEKEGKDDVTPAQLHDAFANQDAQELTRAMLYCFKDVDLLLKLDLKLSITVSLPVYGSVFCVPSTFIQTRGQTVRVVAQCVRTGNNRKDDRIFVEARPTQGDKEEIMDTSYEGATVILPKKGWYHERPVSTLDFESLYPSLMMAYFICPTLLLPEKVSWLEKCVFELWHTKVAEEDREVRLVIKYEGKRIAPLMPNILSDLKALRKGVKREMAQAQDDGDEMLVKMLDAKQSGIKTSMNSMYGFLGANPKMNHLSRPELAALVTQNGRMSLHRVKQFLEEEYPTTTDVIYGDTDSVMIHMLDINLNEEKEQGMKRAFTTGIKYAAEATELLRKERANALSTQFGDGVAFVPMILAFEKIYWPYLLIEKKMYAAGKFESIDKMKMDIKGLSAKRRTTAEVVRKSILDVLNVLVEERDDEKAVALTMENAHKLLNARDSDLVPYEFSQKLSHAYKTGAMCSVKGKEVNVKVEVQFDGKWKPQDPKDWVTMGIAPPEGRATTFPCTRNAYQPWFLLDGNGKQVGRVSLTQPHLHAAVALDERTPGKGPRPGDRVRYVVLNKAHEKATSTILTKKSAYAYCLEDAQDVLEKDASTKLQVIKYYTEFVNGTAMFMDVVRPGTKDTLERLGIEANREMAATIEANKRKGDGDNKRETLKIGGQRSMMSFFTKTSGTWAPSATSDAKRRKV